ncbi:MAG: hypothetical protein J6Q61_09285 [Bacteroidales bacterium]|nr:hypothetical protein [Bacteroidales bacterium]
MTREEEIAKYCEDMGFPLGSCSSINSIKALTASDAIKWADEHPNKKLVYTKHELIDMGFGFDLNGNIVTMNEIKEMDKRYREYRKQKMIDKACEWLDSNFPLQDNVGSWYKEGFIKQFKKAMKGE